jgi:hypothetical protein
MAFSLVLKNIDGVARTYVGGTVSVAAFGSTVITGYSNQYDIALDTGIRSDIDQQRLLINDGFIDLPTTDADVYSWWL